MALIHLRRHSFELPDDPQEEKLSRYGELFARTIGKFYAKTKFTHKAHSHLGRTHRTLDLMSRGAGENFTQESFLLTQRRAEWQTYLREHERLVYDDDLIREEARRMRSQLANYLSHCGQDAVVLAVGHSNLLETLVFGAMGYRTEEPFRECEGAVLQYHVNGEFSLVSQLRIPFDRLCSWFMEEHGRVFGNSRKNLLYIGDYMRLIVQLDNLKADERRAVAQKIRMARDRR